MLEWPLNKPGVDVDAKLRSVGHGQRVVNGFAGFVPELQRELSGILADAAPPFASPAARTALARIYPLRYLVVRDTAERPGHPPRDRPSLTCRVGSSASAVPHGTDDLYEIVPLPERGVVLERWRRMTCSDRVPPPGGAPASPGAGRRRAVGDVTLNGAPVTRTGLDNTTTLSATLMDRSGRRSPT